MVSQTLPKQVVRIEQQYRGDGTTTRQILLAPVDAVFIWDGDEDYIHILCKKLRRTDLKIVRSNWLAQGAREHKYFTGIVTDHGLRLTPEDIFNLSLARIKVRSERMRS